MKEEKERKYADKKVRLASKGKLDPVTTKLREEIKALEEKKLVLFKKTDKRQQENDDMDRFSSDMQRKILLPGLGCFSIIVTTSLAAMIADEVGVVVLVLMVVGIVGGDYFFGLGDKILMLAKKRLKQPKNKVMFSPEWAMNKEYRRHYREIFLEPAVRLLYPELDYKNEKPLLYENIQDVASGLFNDVISAKEYACYSYFTKESPRGTEGMAFVRFNNSIARKAFFDGVLFHFPFRFDIEGQTVLLADSKGAEGLNSDKLHLFEGGKDYYLKKSQTALSFYTSKETHAFGILESPVLSLVQAIPDDWWPSLRLSVCNNQVYLFWELSDAENPIRPTISEPAWSEEREEKLEKLLAIWEFVTANLYA